MQRAFVGVEYGHIREQGRRQEQRGMQGQGDIHSRMWVQKVEVEGRILSALTMTGPSLLKGKMR